MVDSLTVMKINALLLSLVLGADGGGAFGSLWMLDLRDVATFPWHEFCRVDLPGYVRNLFTMISSYVTQYWFRVDAVYVEDPDAIVDVFDVYCKNLLGHRTLKFIGYFSFLLLMAKFLSMFRRGLRHHTGLYYFGKLRRSDWLSPLALNGAAGCSQSRSICDDGACISGLLSLFSNQFHLEPSH